MDSSSVVMLESANVVRIVPGLNAAAAPFPPTATTSDLNDAMRSPVFVASRLKLTELSPVVVEAFYREEIGTGHALLLAKLQPAQQEDALSACYQEQYGSNNKSKRTLLPVRHLQQWIEHNILLELASAPFSKKDAQLVPEAGTCVDCPKRTGHNKLLFADMGTGQKDSCSDPKCYAAKLDAHIRQSIAAKPKLVQISTGYGLPDMRVQFLRKAF